MYPEITRQNWLYAPHHRYGFQHVSEFVRIAVVSRGSGPVRKLLQQPRDLEGILVSGKFGRDAGSSHISFSQALKLTHTDGICVLYDGQIVHEQYFHDMRPETLHLLMSCTKSYIGVLVGIVAHEGLIDLNTEIEHYLPQLAGTGFAGGTVQQHLDMSVGVAFNENYSDATAAINHLDYAVGWRPAPEDYVGPKSLVGFLKGMKDSAYTHGSYFDYRSPISDVLGLLLETVSGKSLAELLSEHLWRPLGCEWDSCFTVDDEGQALADGGLCASLRDLARFGQLMLDNGEVSDRQIVPRSWVASCRYGDEASFDAWRASAFVDRAPNGNYRNQWWCRERTTGVLLASGIHGQALYIDPSAQLVVAKFSSQPQPRDTEIFNLQFALFETLAAYFKA